MDFSTTETVTIYSSLFRLLVDMCVCVCVCVCGGGEKKKIFSIFNTTFGVGDVYP